MASEPSPELKEPQEEESAISWTLIGVIFVIFLCFTIIPAIIFFTDRSSVPSLR